MKSDRRNFIVSILSAVAGISVNSLTYMNNEVYAQAGNELLDPEVYEKQLYCYTDDQKQFINDVLGLVNQGRIPAKMVISCFQWARKKNETSRRFYYFSYALYAQTKEQGIHLSKMLGYSSFEPKNM